jgi:fructokinase
MLLEGGARKAVLQLSARLKRRGVLISFDPNLRLSLWKSASEARRIMNLMIALSAIVKMNTDEAFFLTGCRSIDEAGARIRRKGPALVVITVGKEGCSFSSAMGTGSVHGFQVRAVDTTGCGDAFMAALLHGLENQRGPVGQLPAEILRSICRIANAAGALTALRPGAQASPSRVELDQFLQEQG